MVASVVGCEAGDVRSFSLTAPEPINCWLVVERNNSYSDSLVWLRNGAQWRTKRRECRLRMARPQSNKSRRGLIADPDGGCEQRKDGACFVLGCCCGSIFHGSCYCRSCWRIDDWRRWTSSELYIYNCLKPCNAGSLPKHLLPRKFERSL